MNILDKFNRIDTVSLFSTLSIFLIISFTSYKIINNNLETYLSDSKYSNEDFIAINDDSLDSESDSLKYAPTLLIGNDR